MTDLVRKSLVLMQAENVNLEECIKDGERRLLSALTDGCYSKSPEQLVINAKTILEMYAALKSFENRERTYLLYRFGFNDGRKHSVTNTVFHFSLSESRTKSLEKAAIKKMRKLMFFKGDFSCGGLYIPLLPFPVRRILLFKNPTFASTPPTQNQPEAKV